MGEGIHDKGKIPLLDTCTVEARMTQREVLLLKAGTLRPDDRLKYEACAGRATRVTDHEVEESSLGKSGERI